MTRCSAVALFALALHAQTVYHNPVIPGDNPDSSIIRVGKEYWATATATKWPPIFPLFRSNDLAHWEHVSDVFKEPPSWTKDKFWAPEISEYRHRFFVYYSAECDLSKAGCAVDKDSPNPLCVGVATASSPSGPYTDSGHPLVCQQLGSIDAMAFADGNRRYLIWKEDANSSDCKPPTRIWAQQLSPDGLNVEGPRTELLENDPASWEHNIVEGPFLLKRSRYYYLFYSGAACCGNECNYQLGVARARNLLGLYEKDPANPLLIDNPQWRCPGHGSIVMTPAGHTYLLHHAVPVNTSKWVRNAVLDEVTWTSDGWPVINDHRGVSSEGTIH